MPRGKETKAPAGRESQKSCTRKALVDEAPEAVRRLVRRIADRTYENQQPLRTLLRLLLDPTAVAKPGHQRGWIAEAVASERKKMDPHTYARLTNALTLLMGIDSVVVTTDIAKASRKEALDTLEWCGRTLMEAASQDSKRPRAARKQS